MTKESLQSIIEEQEATNEELKSANEEIESSNEELQSSNEELETAKEELQSTNEELQTLNEELNTRNTEMSQVNNDLENLPLPTTRSIEISEFVPENDIEGGLYLDLAKTLNTLAAFYQEQANYAEAERLHQRVLTIREKALGPDHPEIAASLNNLAGVYRKEGRKEVPEKKPARSIGNHANDRKP